MNLFEELRRRNVIRVGLAYLVTAWLLVQIGDVLFDGFGAPDWVIRVVAVGLALGFIPAVIFAWAFEITPEGIKREAEVDRSTSITNVTARKLDVTIIGLLLVVGGYVFWQSRQATTPVPAATPAIEQTAVAGTQAGIEISDDKSIAVLPFVNLSSDPEQEYFSDGISEELLNVLAQFPDLRVAARTSSFQFKGDNRDISEIAELLKVNHVLEGSVRKAGTRLRITAQLIQAGSGYHLWSQTYDRELQDVFAIQDEISLAIGDAMKVQLALQGSNASAPKVPETSNTLAYEAYLKGRQLNNQRGNLAITEARRQLERSIRLDPNFAPAQAQLAIAITLLNNDSSSYGDLTMSEVQRLATPHIEKALELDPNLAEAQAALALLALNEREFENVIVYADRASKLNPSNIDVLNWKTIALGALGRYEEEKTVGAQMLEIDPLSVVGQMNTIGGYLAQARIAEAESLSDNLVKQHAWAGYTAKINIADTLGDTSQALYWSLRAYGTNPLDRYSNERLARMFAVLDEVEEARRVSPDTRFDAELWSRNYTLALAEAERQAVMDPENSNWLLARAVSMTFLGNKRGALDILLPYVETLPNGAGSLVHHHMLLLAYIHQELGQDEEANAVLDLFDRDLGEAIQAWGTEQGSYWSLANAALLRGDIPKYIKLLELALDFGLRSRMLLQWPGFERVSNHPEVQALESRLRDLLAKEHAEAMEIVCNNNPIPESWQPLPETCASP